MRYLIAVLLAVVFTTFTAHAEPPAFTKTAVHNARGTKPTSHNVTHPNAVQPQPETKAVEIPQPVAQGCETYRSAFAQYAWSVSTALAICEAESRGNTQALSPTGDRGLMQINYIHADMVNGNLAALYNPTTNIAVAYRVYLSQGWHGWSSYNSGKYLSYLQ